MRFASKNDDEVAALVLAATNVEVGTIVPYSEVERVIGVMRGEPRWSSITGRWLREELRLNVTRTQVAVLEAGVSIKEET